MKNLLLASITFIFSFNINAQVTGGIVESGRTVVDEVDYSVKHSFYAKVVVDIAVNIDGEVTSATINKQATTKVSTPLNIKCIERAKKIKFEKGYKYPKFHHGKVIFSVAPEEE